MALFSINCTTCQEELQVHNESAIGEILICPKCESMVMVEPPADWNSPQQEPAPPKPSSSSPSEAEIFAAPPENQETGEESLETVSDSRLYHDVTDAVAETTNEQPSVRAAWEEEAETELPLGAEWVSKSAQGRRKWMLIGGAAVAGVLLLIGLLGFWLTREKQTEIALPSQPLPEDIEPPEPKPTEPAPVEPMEPKPPVEPMEPGPLQPEPAIPTEPAPMEPGPVEPAPMEPAPMEPGPVEPMPTLPLEPAPTPAKTVSTDSLKAFENLLAGGGAPTGFTPQLAPPPKKSGADAVEMKELLDKAPRPRPLQIDLAGRLKDPLAAIKLPPMPLASFLQLMSEMSTIPITIEPDALALGKVSAQTPVNVQMKDATLGGVLQQALSGVNLTAVPQTDDTLLVTRRSDPQKPLREFSHHVGDLTSGDALQAAQLVEWIIELVEPQAWEFAGGEGSLQSKERLLVFRQQELILFRALLLCDKLRVARKLSPTLPFDPKWSQLPPRCRRADAKLEKTLTASYLQPAKLTAILNRLGQTTDLRILVDWQAVAKDGWNPQAETSFSADALPLREILPKLLGPLDLSYRVLDESTLQVTTLEALHEQRDLELYPAAHLIKPQQNAEQLIERIEKELGRPLQKQGGVLRFDAVSGHLLASLSQPLHRELQKLLVKWK